MAVTWRSFARWGSVSLASVLAHATAVIVCGGGAWHPLEAKHQLASSHRFPSTDAPLALPTVDLVTLKEEGEVNREGSPPVASGGDTIARVDTGDRGRGGDPTDAWQAIHMSATAEPLRVSPDLRSHVDRNQAQRIASGHDRTAWEDRRATTHPMELTFLATGTGHVTERRPNAATSPDRGAMNADAPRALGGVRGGGALPLVGVEVSGGDALGPVGEREGSSQDAPGLGIHSAKPGHDHRRAAPIMRARPSVVEGPPTILAEVRKRPHDTRDTEQEVATALASLVHASSSGGSEGSGLGGSTGGGDPGAGGLHGAGSHPQPLGVGDPNWFDMDTTDPRLLPYFRKIRAKVHPLWANAFPREAVLDLRQGTVILEFTIEANGRAEVDWPPVRPSGIDEFDRNCAEALRKASPFDPIPAVLGVRRLRVRAPFTVSNPVIR